MTRFLTALTLAIFCLEFASCELTLENVYAEVLSLRTVVKSMEKKLLVQEVQMGELNKIISEQRDLLDQARAENRESSWEVPHTEEGTKTKEFLRGQQEGVSVSDVISNNTSSYFTHHPQNKEPINGGHRVHRGIDGFLRQGLHDSNTSNQDLYFTLLYLYNLYLIGHFRQLLLISLVPEILTVGQLMELDLLLFINTKSIIPNAPIVSRNMYLIL